MGLVASIVGATGLVGQELVRQLCLDIQVATVHVLVRRPLSLEPIQGGSKLVQHIVDFNRLDDVSWPHSDVIFCCLGTTIRVAGSRDAFRNVDYGYVVNAARKAHQAGAASLIVVSAMGANSQSSLFYNRIKGEMEAAVANLGFASTVIFRPSFLAGKRTQSRPGEQFALAVLKIGNLFLPLKYRSIAAHAVAKGMLIAAKEKPSGVQIIESDKMQKWT